MGVGSSSDVFRASYIWQYSCIRAARLILCPGQPDSDLAPQRPRLASVHMVIARRSCTLRHYNIRRNRCLSMHEVSSFYWLLYQEYMVGIWSIFDFFRGLYILQYVMCMMIYIYIYIHIYCKATCVCLMTFGTLFRAYGHSLTRTCPYVWQLVLA